MQQNSIFSVKEKISLSAISALFAASLLCCLYGRRTACMFFILLLALHSLWQLFPHKSVPLPSSGGLAQESPAPEQEKASLMQKETIQKDRAELERLMAENSRYALSLEKAGNLRNICVLPEDTSAPLTLLDLAAFSKDMLREFESLPAYGKVRGLVQCSGQSLLLPVDRALLRLLFISLLDNAYKSLAVSGRSPARLTLTLSGDEDGVLIIFRDNGRGVRQEELPRLFERNYQGENKISGSGLGLFQAKCIADRIGASLSIKSTPDSGFAVYLKLPAPKKEENTTEKKDLP